MDRRRIGIVLLIAVTLAAIVIPGITGRKVIGSPIAAVIPPPPTVGYCVTAISALPPTEADTDIDTRATFPSVEQGACSGPIVGEVMSVDLTAHDLSKATVGSYQLAASACELSEVNYVGSIGPFDPATITTPGIAWQADVTVESIAIGPTALQRAGGQTWTGCVGAAPDRGEYRGSLAGALTVGTLPSLFATCWKALPTVNSDVGAPEASCATAHPIEVLALTQVTDTTTTLAQIRKTCTGMASRALRTPDPTRGGRLTISAYPLGGPPESGAAAGSLLDQGFGCLASVAAPRTLTGTVIGVGSGPLPISG